MPTVAAKQLAAKLKAATNTPFGAFPANTTLFNISQSLYNTLVQLGYADKLAEGVEFGNPSYDADKNIYTNAAGEVVAPPGTTPNPGGGGGAPTPTPGTGPQITQVTTTQYNNLLSSSSLVALAFYLVGGTKLVLATSGNAALTVVDSGGGTPTPTPTPAPLFTTQPSISPTSGNVGATFTANNGAASDTTSYTRRWLLSGTQIGTGATVTPVTAGNLVLEVTATGPGGSKVATSAAVTVASAGGGTPANALTLGGDPLTIGGQALTLG